MSLFKKGGKGPEGLCCISTGEHGLSAAHIIPNAPYLKSSTLLAKGKAHSIKDLAPWVKERGLTNANCAYVLSNNDYRLILLDMPSVPESEYRSAAPWLVKELIDFPLDEAAIDVFPIPFISKGKEKAYVVVTKLAVLEKLNADMAAIGLNLMQIDILELAYAGLLCHQDNSGDARGLLYVNDGHVQLLILKEGVVHLIRKLGEVSEIENNPDAIISELQLSLDFFQNQLRQKPLAKLSLVPHLYEQQAFSLSLNTKITIPTDQMDVGALLKVDVARECEAVIGEGLAYYAAKD